MRRRKAKKIAILPDPKFNEVVVTKFVNNLMFSGKKNLAFRIFYDAIDMVNEKWKTKNWFRSLEESD
jgi:small subunit ribosomal protein S7